MVVTSVSAASRVTPPEPIPRPTSATPIGSPAATNEPKARNRISSARPMPTSSAVPPGVLMFSGIWPPSSTW